MTHDQSIEQLAMAELFQEYTFLETKKELILNEITSNSVIIQEQFINMEVIVENGLENPDDLIELDLCLTKLNTYIAMAFLNMVEDDAIEFKYLTRLPSLLFKMNMNKICILKSITIDGRKNRFTTLPEEIGFLHELEILDLNHCHLHILPKEIGLASSLHNLNLDYNEIDSLPPEIGQLAELEELHLRHNHLKELPMELLQLAHLKLIDIDENDIKALPKEFSKYIH